MKTFLIAALMMFSIETLADTCPQKSQELTWLLQQTWFSKTPGYLNIAFGTDEMGSSGGGYAHTRYFYCYEDGLITLRDIKEKKIVGVFKVKEIDKEKLVLTVPFKLDVIEYCRAEICPNLHKLTR